MEVGLGPEALDPADDGRARNVALAKQFHDGLVERPALSVVTLADVDADKQAGSFEFHASALPRVRPAKTAHIPSTPERPMFSRARFQLPSSARRHDSSISVENVVYAPRKPIITGPRMRGSIEVFSSARANSRPRVKAPLMFMTKVPSGKAP